MARTPSPASKVLPSNENPRTIPVSALNVASANPDETPVNATPSVSN